MVVLLLLENGPALFTKIARKIEGRCGECIQTFFVLNLQFYVAGR
jgi:hypothetical protein